MGDFHLEAGAGDMRAEGAVKVTIRPERVQVEPYGTDVSAGANRIPGMIERLVFLGSSTQVIVRLAPGAAVQALIQNDGEEPPYRQGTPVSVVLPAEALRVLRTA
jgi:spermidine/putrescine transport system ATP-binding protein